MSQNDESRKAFEHWYDKPELIGKDWEGVYINPIVNSHFKVWQASESRTEAKYAELVSVLESIRSECSNWKKHSGKQPRWDCDAPETVKAVDALAAEALSRIQKGGS